MTLGRVGCAIIPGRAPEWTFVVGHGFLAAVPAATPQWIIASLTDLIALPSVEIESVVSLLPISGDDAVASFAVAVPGAVAVPRAATDTDGIPVSAVIHGAAAADVFSIGGSRRFTDRDIRPWLLADFQAVTGMVFGSQHVTMVSADLLASGTPIGVGAVPGHTLFWSTGAAAVLHSASPRSPSPHSASPHSAVLHTPYAPSAHPPSAHPPSANSPAAFDDTIKRAPRSAGFPEADADTILRARPGSGVAGDDDGPTDQAFTDDTVIRARPRVEDTVLLHQRKQEAAAAAAAVPATVLPRYGFRLGGEDWRLDTVYYVGRRPITPRGVANRPRLLTVRSATSAVSGTHIEIRQEGDSVVVTDLGSTNGTTVLSPNGKKERMRRGASLTVIPGTRVDIGDGNIIEILPVSGH
jgi:hypothetical protein